MPKTPEQHLALLREFVAGSLEAALDWREQKHAGWELFNLLGAVQNSIAIAVSGYPTPAAAVEYLQTDFEPHVFDRTYVLIHDIHIDGSGPPFNTPPAGLSQFVLTVHAAWLLGLHEHAEAIASVCGNAEQQRFYQSDTLWRDYARGIDAVAHRHPFTPAERKYRGYDRHWATYLRLMADIAVGKDSTSFIADIDESFTQRNRDRRLDGDGLDGDGTFPVKWDFRKHSLLIAADKTR